MGRVIKNTYADPWGQTISNWRIAAGNWVNNIWSGYKDYKSKKYSNETDELYTAMFNPDLRIGRL